MRATAVLLLAALAGCSGMTVPSATLELTLQGGADQNPDAIGNPAPVAVHVYHLASAERFERADLFALIEREAATLGTDVLRSEEFVLAPGEISKIRQPINNNVRYVGIIVLFRDIDHATWRAMSPVSTSAPLILVLKTAGIVAALIKA